MLWWNSLNWGNRNFITGENYRNFTRVLHMRNSAWGSQQSLFPPAVLLQSGWFYGFLKSRMFSQDPQCTAYYNESNFYFFSVLDWFGFISRNLIVLLISLPSLFLPLIFCKLLHWSRFLNYLFSTLLILKFCTVSCLQSTLNFNVQNWLRCKVKIISLFLFQAKEYKILVYPNNIDYI